MIHIYKYIIITYTKYVHTHTHTHTHTHRNKIFSSFIYSELFLNDDELPARVFDIHL